MNPTALVKPYDPAWADWFLTLRALLADVLGDERKATLPVHHLYACPEDSPALAEHLFFREWMKTHPDDRAEYTRKKFLLADLCDHDRRLYADVKAVALDSFFGRILAQI